VTDLLDTPDAGPAAIRGGGLRIVSYGFGVLLTVASAAALFRHLGVDDAGRYVTVLALVTVAGGITDAGLIAIGMREMAVRDPAARDSFIRNLMGMRIVLTLVGIGAATAFAAIAGYTSAMVIGTVLAGIGFVFQAVQSALAVPLMADLRLGWVALLDLLKQVVTVVLIFALVIAGASLLPFLAIPIPAGIAIVLATAILVRRDVPLVPAFHAGEWWSLLRDTIPFAAATAVSVIYFRLAIVIMSLVASATETGYFSASFRVIEVLTVVPQLLVGAAFPILARAARDDHERLNYGVGRVLQVSVIVGATLAIGLILGAPFVIDVIAGSSFHPAVPVLRIQAIALVASFAAATFGYALLSLRLHREVLAMFLVALVLSSGLTIWLGSVDGAQGAAIATTTAELGLALAGAIVLARSKARLRPPLGGVVRVLVAATAALAPMLIEGFPTAARLAVGGCIYVVLLVLLRAIPEELWVELRRMRDSLAAR
jgi:O-antigen/teichoic acid export membrane protein